ncbi:MAG TPA: flagellar basal-body rod protein FlgG [Phycisphaerae bacterium]|nr:flagellar basal-body rod protein FlgG [Phycisphaerae bacterium]
MLRAFSTAATGMTGQQMIVDVIANNLANINTTGFKRSQVDFQDLMYLKLAQAGRETASGVVAPTGIEIGSGVRLAATTKVFTPGELENTGRQLDVAISGDGFFEVTLPDGSTRYTRDGSFQLNASRELVTSKGYTLGGGLTIPQEAVQISIGVDGTVTCHTASGTTTNVGTLSLVRFPNASGLSSEGDNLLAATEASGTAITGTAGAQGFGTLQQSFLEKSNVQMVTELVNLIKAQRAYEINSRAIRAGDEMLNTANRLIS